MPQVYAPSDTVSYTHLDVYKRQAYELLSRNEMIRHHYQERFRFILVDEFQAVSYTHLDVYKRQILHRLKIRATRNRKFLRFVT